MKQILQDLKTGETRLAEVPCPTVLPGQLLIRTSSSLISAGTERMLVDFGKANWLEKARQQPDKVRMVMDKIKTDGLLPTIDAVRNKLDQALPMGYCNVGTAIGVPPGVRGFSVADRIASNGKHAEVVSVPVNLCAKIPDSVSDDEAAFTVIGAIALQGIRLAAPSLGEAVAVTGLGLIGQVAVQLLRAQGCRVLGIDFDPARLELAASFGAEVVRMDKGADPVRAAEQFSRGRGMDAVIVTAATQSSGPMHQAAQMCRKRGRIVLVGVTGLELSRDDFFKKELSFQVSCSYGPGRYDPDYEEKGQDYPVGYVRWTEQRNFEAVLDMMADGRINVKPLISHRFQLDDAEKAYAVVAGGEPSLGILLEYPHKAEAAKLLNPHIAIAARPAGKRGRAAVSFIGAGNYATSTLIPAFKAAGAHLRAVADNNGTSSAHAGKKFGFERATTDAAPLLAYEGADAVVVTTRHDSHASIVAGALRAGKHVFVEKPLCLTAAELGFIQEAFAARAGQAMVMVGFNRRFSPLVQKVKELLAGVNGPKAFVMTVNAGAIQADHWTQDPAIGGGRILGEACHFIDLLRHLAGCRIVFHSSAYMDSKTADTAMLQFSYADGSIGTVHYYANGPKSFPKERLEVFAAGRVLQLDNFRRLTGYGWPNFRKMNLWTQDKGQKNCAKAFLRAMESGSGSPIPFEELTEVAQVTIALAAGRA